MKIAQVIIRFWPAVGGAEEHVLEISRRLVRDGHDVTVYTSDLESEVPWKRLREMPKEYLGVKIKRFKAINHFYPILKGLRIDDCDLIHTHAMPKSYSDFIVRRYKNVVLSTVGLHLHDDPRKKSFFGYLFRQILIKLYYLLIGKNTLRKAKVIHCFSTHEKEYVRSLGVKNKIQVIPSGVNLKDYKKGVNKGYLLFIGRIDRGKGLEHLIKALKGTKEKLVIVGKDFGYLDELKKLVKESGVSVEFKGYVAKNEKKRLLSNCKALVLPSKYESFGRVIIEALASGKPVVATRMGGITDIIKENLVDYGDVVTLRKAIKNPKLEKVDLTKYDWDEVYNKTLKMYKSINGK